MAIASSGGSTHRIARGPVESWLSVWLLLPIGLALIWSGLVCECVNAMGWGRILARTNGSAGAMGESEPNSQAEDQPEQAAGQNHQGFGQN